MAEIPYFFFVRCWILSSCLYMTSPHIWMLFWLGTGRRNFRTMLFPSFSCSGGGSSNCLWSWWRGGAGHVCTFVWMVGVRSATNELMAIGPSAMRCDVLPWLFTVFTTPPRQCVCRWILAAEARIQKTSPRVGQKDTIFHHKNWKWRCTLDLMSMPCSIHFYTIHSIFRHTQFVVPMTAKVRGC